MPEKSWRFFVDPQIEIVVKFLSKNGEIINFLVMLLWHDEDKAYCVARYDNAHGIPHCDIVSASGQILEKRWFKGYSNKEIVRYGIEDFKRNWQKYYEAFQKKAS